MTGNIVIRDYSFLNWALGPLAKNYVFFDAEGAWCLSSEEYLPACATTQINLYTVPVWCIAPGGAVTHYGGPYAEWEPAVARLWIEPAEKYVNLSAKIAGVTE